MNEIDFLESELTAFDFETTGLNAHKGAEYFSYSIARPILDDRGEPIDFNVLVNRIDNKDEGLNKYNNEFLHEYWRQKRKKRTIHNLKFELHFLDKHDVEVEPSIELHDTMIMSQMLCNLCQSHALDYLCWLRGGYSRDLDTQIRIAASAVGKNYQRIDQKLMTKYQHADGERGLLLYYLFINDIKKDRLIYKDYQNEIDLIIATQKMEKQGILLDVDNIQSLREWLGNELDKVQNETFELLGEFVNLNSDDTVARLLYRKYKMPILNLTETGKASTDKDTLAALRELHKHPIFDLILRQRSYSDGLSKLSSYLKHGGENGRINPNINTNEARTGRQSSSGPNLQNVSRKAALKNLFPVPLRQSFRADPGHVLIFVDYSGIEMRLIVEATGENELLDMLLADSLADLHHPTVECFLGRKEARRLLKEDYKGYKILRFAFKNTGFCIAYGGSVAKVAFTLMKPVEEIRAGDAAYRKRFKRIDNFTKNIIDEVRKNKYVTTSFGRKLFVPIEKAYIGSNYLIQGTAAGVLKRAQVRVARFLKKEVNDRIKFILPIHDEIIFSYPRTLLPRKTEILTEVSRIMTNMPEISVPLEVEWKMSTTDWDAAKEFTLTRKE